ncbi:winged helix-turn-helix domain-containing protein [Pseudomonas sp. RC4D1]|uniref:winged helix-turn-helix domain-containing protein n=1 Tax=Pseudomonas sp. RC4D1 TaxID=2834407 RepID=UPI001BD155CB|nr:winged helix-turn-helix domain-containing protein [Pseudomonas sp. RC4D1]
MQIIEELAKIETSDHKVETRKITIRCPAANRNVVFLPSQSFLIVHESGVEKKIELGFSSSRILELLIDKVDSVVARDEIFAYAWPDRIVGQNSLNQAVSTLRELLSDEDNRSIIQTVPRRGYQFNSEFIVSSEFILPDNLTEPENGVDRPVIEDARIGFQDLMLSWLKESGLSTLVILLVVAFLVRIDWGLWIQPDFVQEVETQGLLTTWYTGANDDELNELKKNTSAIQKRIMNLLEAPGTVIFNTMHGFYEILCVSGSTVEFIGVYKSRLSSVTDEQLVRCLK